MNIVSVDLSDRSFLIQFWEIVQEFGEEIPWLEKISTARYVAGADRFRDRILQGLRLPDESMIEPLQIMSSGAEYLGGILRFSESPENFTDPFNRSIHHNLSEQGLPFLSCLQIRKDQRDHRYGPTLLNWIVEDTLSKHGNFWAVTSEMRLIHWYESSGATIMSPLVNEDDLWILVWER